MSRFHVVEDVAVVLRSKNGVFRQAKVFRREDYLYAGYSAGFVQLYKSGGTSCPTISWSDIDLGSQGLKSDALGRVQLAG